MAGSPPRSDEPPPPGVDAGVWLDELGLDATVAAAPCGATIRPPDRRGPASPSPVAMLATELAPTSGAEPEALPTISILLPQGGAPSPSPTPAPSDASDLVITGALGAGAMGRVLLARQRSLQRDVAIKTVHPGADATSSQALLHEGVVTGQLEHPSIIPVHALGLDRAGAPALVMKRIEGVPWRRLLEDASDPAWAAWDDGSRDRLTSHLEILKQVCNAVHFAHSRGVLHRDIKPDNVMLGRFGEVYVVDWGIAIRIGDGADKATFGGTPLYMAPEMVLGGPLDARTDVYLLAAVLHEVLTGHPRHDGANVAEVLHAASQSRPFAYAPSVPEELANLCNRATHRDRERRPRSALELRQEIDSHLRHKSSFALADSAADRLDELTSLLERAAPTGALDDADVQTITRVATECRFGYLQALQQWEGNAAAARGLRACVQATVELELRRRDAQRARALLDELSDPEPELARRVTDLERELARQRQDDEELRRRAKDMDPTTSARARILGVAIIGAITTGMSVFLVRPWSPSITRQQAAAFAAALFVAIAVGGALGRRHLLKNEFDRRAFGLLCVASASMLVTRLVALRVEASMFSILVNNLVAFTAVAAAGALTLFRWLWWLAVTFAVGLGAMLAVPEFHVELFALATSGSMVVTGYFLWRQRRPAD